jgi:hypothetical protein
MASPRRFLVRGSVNAEVKFRFVRWDPVAEIYVPVPVTLALTPPGFAEGTFLRPSRVQETFPLVDAGSSALGFLSFFTPSGFLDELGEWQAGGRVKIPGSSSGEGVFPSVPVKFKVEKGLLDPGSGVVTPSPVQVVISVPAPGIT